MISTVSVKIDHNYLRNLLFVAPDEIQHGMFSSALGVAFLKNPVVQQEPEISTKLSRSYVWLVASVAAISGFLFGFDTAVINGALVFLRRQFALNNLFTEIAASSLLLGCLIGAAGSGALSDRFGRRRSLMGSALLFTISATGSATANGLAAFSLARFAGGLAIGLASVLTPVYISEVAPRSNRGQLVSLNQLAIVVGILAAYLTNWQFAALGESSWRWMFGAAAIPSIGFLLGLAFIPESPRWLITHGHRDAGYAVLAKIAGPIDAKIELAAIEFSVSEKSGDTREIFAPPIRKRLFVAVLLAVLQQVSGINTVLYYGSVLFTEQFHDESARTALGANVLVGLVNLLCTLVAMVFIDRWGRRGLFLTASAGMAASLAVLAFSLHVPAAPVTIIFGSVLLYVAFFAVGLGPGVWVYIAEIFPTRVRGRATSVATSALWAACLVVTLTFLSIVEALGTSLAFLSYAALSLVAFVFVWKYVPETRGKSLEEIQQVWSRQ